MNGAFYIGATGLRSEQQALDVVANNIANINTPAFKRAQVRFSELVGGTSTEASGANGSRAGGAAGPWSVSAVDTLAGVSADASPRVFTQGQLTTTGQTMDLAISGDGFIELLGAGGQTMLWRGGTLQVNSDGYLAASDSGFPLKAQISVPTGATNMVINAAGQVSATLPGASQPSVLGQIDLVMPKDVNAIEDTGAELYKAQSDTQLMSVAPGQEGAGTLVQGSVESSNVQLTDEMVNMLMIQRAYAANAQVVQAGDQLMSIANGLRR
jgi:flagellar basal-body rod protein FlgG